MTKYEFIRSLTDEQMSALFENFVEKQTFYFPNLPTASPSSPYFPCETCMHPTQCYACPYSKKWDVTCTSEEHTYENQTET